ncbi:HNH endonuclease signature motif containing protein [Leptothoe sp. PORK10 BA2]|uniref:HNH endonuclease signature motif containing protein n=1 Tax=Leptothoe sp. PORK10 BA2 TaxID=3110254 RepID=UPI002B1E94B7|nr:HNH endonuclease [Leptothoe sp. PORK10 BA2]MEA5467020.1 HNH endonuclease [Leptothoe sp. PORK10 BA2]
MPMDRSLYPANWDELALQIKTEANWCCTDCGRPCRQPGEALSALYERLPDSWKPLWWEADGDVRAPRPGRFKLTVAHLDHVPQNNQPSNLRALCAPCHGTYDLKQMGRKRVLKAERNGQLRTDDILNGAQLALLPEVAVYQRVDPRSGGRRTIVRKPLDGSGSQWRYRAPGNASGWIEERMGNRGRANPSISHYYRWDSHKGRVSEYIRASQVTRVAGLIEAERPALEVLRVVVEGKRKVSGVSAELLGKT